ncbi:nucleoside-diphosphate-sugar epimerase family protein, partial [Lasiosphaeria miniovina]
MAILLTGGANAQTARRIASLCDEAKIPYLFASRSAPASGSSNPPQVKFDWTDASTYENPFQYSFPGGESIRAVYMIMPRVPQPEKHINAFIDVAVARGAKRFVFMAGTTVAKPTSEGPANVWQHMLDKGVEWAVCRPTWFMDNLADGLHQKTLKEDGKLYSCIGDAKVPFISAVDIGSVAFAALTASKPPNIDYRIVGPDLLTYDQVAAQLAEVLGRPVEHVRLTPEERTEQLKKLGLDAHSAQYTTWLESQASGEEHMNDTVEKVTGKPPVSFHTFIEQNK